MTVVMHALILNARRVARNGVYRFVSIQRKIDGHKRTKISAALLAQT